MKLIKQFEGLALNAYLDSGGVATIGYGTTVYPDGTKVELGDACTKEQAERWLSHHVSKIKLPKHKNFTKGQKEALQSLIYNVGQYAFDRSKLRQAIVDDDYLEILHQWDWIKAGGQVLRGLVKRRAIELQMYLKDI